MSRTVAGNIYYGTFDSQKCKAIFIHQCPAQKDKDGQDQKIYLVAVPSQEGEERAQAIRDPDGVTLYVKVLAVPRLTFPRTASAGTIYRDWGDRVPTVSSLMDLLKTPEALPARVNESNVVEVLLSETESPEPPLDAQYETNLELVRLFAPIQTESNDNRANLPQQTPEIPSNVGSAILDAVNKLSARVERLESPRPVQEMQRVPHRASGTVHRNPAYAGAFGDCDLEAELERAKDAAPLRHPSNTITPPPPAIAQPTIAAASSLDPALVDWMKSISEAVVHRQGAMSASQAQLFKLHGAKGRVAQDQLNRDFNSNPQGVVEGFEEAVLRRAGAHDRVGAGGSAGAAAADVLLDTWRDTVPAREAQSTARIGEAVIDAYCAIRRGDPMRGAARLALLIGAMEQCTLDNYRWHPRASTMTGMPPLPMQRYQALPAEAKKGQDAGAKKLGEMAQLCDPVRATTALAVHKDAEA